MYSKVLVPLDGSQEAEKVLRVVSDALEPEGEMVLLHVIPDEAQRKETMKYLQRVGRQHLGSSRRWRSETTVSASVFIGILDVATREGADLIALYHEADMDLIELLKGRTTANVELWSPVEVKVFKPEELPDGGSRED